MCTTECPHHSVFFKLVHRIVRYAVITEFSTKLGIPGLEIGIGVKKTNLEIESRK